MWRDFFPELTTGLRGGVICALQWDNLNPKTGELQVERQVHRVRGELMASPPKTKAWRTAVLLHCQRKAHDSGGTVPPEP